MRMPRIVGNDDCFDLYFDGVDGADRTAMIEECLAAEDDCANNYDTDPE